MAAPTVAAATPIAVNLAVGKPSFDCTCGRTLAFVAKKSGKAILSRGPGR
ncbi:hypothetical protein [Synechococcus sp. CBW1107]|nr:hypothetical protein [Synechococcus sp. CBW1107]CAK6689430.1 hypothetical protein IFHNHDMJ_00606 [Synechococcus sp. CBW1107]